VIGSYAKHHLVVAQTAMIESVETFSLLLVDLIEEAAKVVVVTGDDGTIEGLSLATYFAGYSQRHFPGGMFVITSKKDDIEQNVKKVLVEHTRPGRALLILTDRFFPDTYSFEPRKLLANHPEACIIFVSKHPAGVKGSDLQINLNGTTATTAKPHTIHLDHEESKRQQSWN